MNPRNFNNLLVNIMVRRIRKKDKEQVKELLENIAGVVKLARESGMRKERFLDITEGTWDLLEMGSPFDSETVTH